jgi:hypothetical protein
MKADCVGCRYKSDSKCAYTGNGCAFDKTITIENPVTPPVSIVKLVDLSPESIDKIANATIERLSKLERDSVKHGHWKYYCDFRGDCSHAQCSECGTKFYLTQELENYCTHCGAKNDEPEEYFDHHGVNMNEVTKCSK